MPLLMPVNEPSAATPYNDVPIITKQTFPSEYREWQSPLCNSRLPGRDLTILDESIVTLTAA
jgi:hypothetical protein